MKRFGFFDDLPRDRAVAELESRRRPRSFPHDRDVIRYLKGGHRVLLVAGVTTDLLSEADDVIGSPHIFTDGEWFWTADVIHYIENYHIQVPDDLLAKMKKKDWKCPEVDPDALDEAEVLAQFGGALGQQDGELS